MQLKLFFPALLFPLFITAQNADSIVFHMGMRLDSSFANYDSSYFISVFNVDEFTNYFYLVDTSEQELSGFNAGFKSALGYNLYGAIFRATRAGASYDFINYYQDYNEAYHLLFRLYLADAGLNYHDFVLYPDETGTLRITDVFIYATGEYMSETLYRIYYPAITRILNEDYFNKEKKTLYDSYFKLGQINKYLEEGNRAKARLLFRTIPKEIRQDKIFILMEIKMLEPEDEKAYAKLLEKRASLFPDDPAIYLWNVDRYIMRGEFSNALAMIDTLESMTDDDFLNFIRGNIFFQMNDYEKAEASYQYMIENYPGFEDCYHSLLEMKVLAEKFTEATQLLDLLIEKFGYIRESLIEVVDTHYEDFSKSVEYQKWRSK